jgi:hypothetical protein
MNLDRRLAMKRVSMAVLAALVLVSVKAQLAPAQQILIDKPVRAGELTCFPDLNDPLSYYYVTDKPHLAKDAAGRPQFSFLRYVENVRSGTGQPDAREGEGGGIVHAVVELSVTQDQLTAARQALERATPGAKLVGPVVFKSGKFGLISSFKDTNGEFTKQVVGLGNAPLLDGEKASVSVQLTKLGAKILWESFQTPTPDLSFTFEMEVAGYRSPHRAVVEANFDQVYEHKAFAMGVATQYLAAEIKSAFDDLTKSGAIKLTQVGQDEKLEAMITTAYNKISDMMFSTSGGSGAPDASTLAGAGNQASMLDRATQYLQARRQEAKAENEKIRAENRALREARQRAEEKSRRERMAALAAAEPGGSRDAANDSLDWGPSMAIEARPYDEPRSEGSSGERQEEAVPTFAVIASYEMKSVRQRGTFQVDLNKYTTDRLILRFDENVGDLRSQMNEGNFRQVNLDDPLYKQRDLAVFVDGMNANDFGDYINFATVQLRKKHQGGQESQDEVRIDRKNFSAEGNTFKLLYGWKNDTDRQAWMNYEYQTTWNFFGGTELQTPWRKASAGAIGLSPPFRKASVDLQADPDLIAQAGVRLITVKIYYKLGGTEQVKQVSLNTSKGQLSDRVDFILPAGALDYDYEVTWQLKGNRSVSSGRKKTSQSILFVDDVAAG